MPGRGYIHRAKWRAIEEVYIQQWNAIDCWSDDLDESPTCLAFQRIYELAIAIGVMASLAGNIYSGHL